VACVRTEPSVGKGLWTHRTQPGVGHGHRTHRTYRTQSPGWSSQDATLPYLTQATFLLMNRQEENDLCLDLVCGESHFNFIKMHLLSYFYDHICQFGNILIYSTVIGELAHKTQIQDGWYQSNKKIQRARLSIVTVINMPSDIYDC